MRGPARPGPVEQARFFREWAALAGPAGIRYNLIEVPAFFVLAGALLPDGLHRLAARGTHLVRTDLHGQVTVALGPDGPAVTTARIP